MNLSFARWAGIILLLLQLFFILNIAFGGQSTIPAIDEEGVWAFLDFFLDGILGTVILFVTQIIDFVQSRKRVNKNNGK